MNIILLLGIWFNTSLTDNENISSCPKNKYVEDLIFKVADATIELKKKKDYIVIQDVSLSSKKNIMFVEFEDDHTMFRFVSPSETTPSEYSKYFRKIENTYHNLKIVLDKMMRFILINYNAKLPLTIYFTMCGSFVGNILSEEDCDKVEYVRYEMLNTLKNFFIGKNFIVKFYNYKIQMYAEILICRPEIKNLIENAFSNNLPPKCFGKENTIIGSKSDNIQIIYFFEFEFWEKIDSIIDNFIKTMNKNFSDDIYLKQNVFFLSFFKKIASLTDEEFALQAHTRFKLFESVLEFVFSKLQLMYNDKDFLSSNIPEMILKFPNNFTDILKNIFAECSDYRDVLQEFLNVMYKYNSKETDFKNNMKYIFSFLSKILNSFGDLIKKTQETPTKKKLLEEFYQAATTEIIEELKLYIFSWLRNLLAYSRKDSRKNNIQRYEEILSILEDGEFSNPSRVEEPVPLDIFQILCNEVQHASEYETYHKLKVEKLKKNKSAKGNAQ